MTGGDDGLTALMYSNTSSNTSSNTASNTASNTDRTSWVYVSPHWASATAADTSIPETCTCCGRSHVGMRRRWVAACSRAWKLAKGDPDLASRFFPLEIDRPKRATALAADYAPAPLPMLSVWCRTFAAVRPRPGRLSLRRVPSRRKREARPYWRRIKA